MKKLQILIFMLFIVFSLKAQAPFEGTIKMNLQYEGGAASMMQSMSPSTMIFKMKGANTSIKMNGGMSAMIGKMITKGNIFYMVMDMAKTVYRVDQDAEDENMNGGDEGGDEDVFSKEIVDLKETEVIAGYKCKKYKVVPAQKDAEISSYFIWIAQDFNAKFTGKDKMANDLFNNKLGGFPFKQEMSMTTPMGDVKTITTVTEVTKGDVPDSEFELPEGYAVKPMEEMMNGMMNGMGGGN